jgi:hypothetical protein
MLHALLKLSLMKLLEHAKNVKILCAILAPQMMNVHLVWKIISIYHISYIQEEFVCRAVHKGTMNNMSHFKVVNYVWIIV